MVEYTTQCIVCGSNVTTTRKDKVSPAGRKGLPNYCADCKGLIHMGNQNARKHSEPAYVKSSGYSYIYVEGKYVAEHRYVMEQELGRKLQLGEIVHHIDGNKVNNKPENLELWVNVHSIHGVRAASLICPHCSKPYLPI